MHYKQFYKFRQLQLFVYHGVLFNYFARRCTCPEKEDNSK